MQYYLWFILFWQIDVYSVDATLALYKVDSCLIDTSDRCLISVYANRTESRLRICEVQDIWRRRSSHQHVQRTTHTEQSAQGLQNQQQQQQQRCHWCSRYTEQIEHLLPELLNDWLLAWHFPKWCVDVPPTVISRLSSPHKSSLKHKPRCAPGPLPGKFTTPFP